MTYHDAQGNEIEDLEMDKMRQEPPALADEIIALGATEQQLKADAMNCIQTIRHFLKEPRGRLQHWSFRQNGRITAVKTSKNRLNEVAQALIGTDDRVWASAEPIIRQAEEWLAGEEVK